MQRRVLGVLGGVGAVVAVVAVARAQHQRALASAATTTTAADAPISRVPGCTFAPGAELSYGIAATVEMKLEAPPGASAPPSSGLGRTAHLVLGLRALETDPTGTVLLARYRQVEASLLNEMGDLTTPFLVRIDPRCQVAGYARLDTTGVREGRAQQAMTYNLGWSWPDKGGPTTRDGVDDFGRFRATYRDVSGTRPKIERKIEAYSVAWADAWAHEPFGPTGEDAPAAPRPVARKEHRPHASSLVVDAGPGPWFTSLEGTEKMQAMGADLESRISAHVVDTPKDAFDGASTDRARYVWEDLLHRRVKPRIAEPVGAKERARIEEARALTFEQAMEAYLGHVRAEENIAQTWPHLQRWLVAHPDGATTIGRMIHDGKLPEEGSAGVFIALAKTPTREARAALVMLNRDPSVAPMDRSRAAFSLVEREDVGLPFAKDLHADSRAVTAGAARKDRLYGRHAALALGMMASLKGADEPGIADEARAAVTELLHDARGVITLKPAFGTVANIGDPALLPQLAPYFGNADPEIRRASTIAIRRMPPALTRELVVAWLRTETDPDVKRDLYHTVHLQHVDAQTIADRAIVAQAIPDLASRPGVLARQSLIRILGDAKDAYPEAKAALVAAVPRELAAKEEGMMPLLLQYLSTSEVVAFMPPGSELPQ